ncbi:glycosyltransferase [Rhodococcus sp. MEB064]|uniref:glycosyltransferase n=1 Tax=Rhodococcus sp. MEB064 TaxID=1587522 RepID=UPI0005ABDD4A|nr:glycosyltransferase [Rhodococcus sp. MEB064]
MKDDILSTVVPPGSKVLWVASSGGHFAQLSRFADASAAHADSRWVTFDTPQTQGAATRFEKTYFPYVAPRDWRGVGRAAALTKSLLAREHFDMCISTGAALALGVLPVAAARGISTHYIESVSRVAGPSVTGRLLHRVPRINTYTQHRSWAGKNWEWIGSVLDTWTSHPRHDVVTPRKIFVTLGTIKPYRFDRAIDAVLGVTRPDDDVVWQLGCTTRHDLPGTVHNEISPAAFHHYAATSDITVTHAGVGSIMQLLDMGITPSIVVREREASEHVDDHQRQIADEMTRRGLAFELDLSAPDRVTLDRSARRIALAA